MIIPVHTSDNEVYHKIIISIEVKQVETRKLNKPCRKHHKYNKNKKHQLQYTLKVPSREWVLMGRLFTLQACGFRVRHEVKIEGVNWAFFWAKFCCKFWPKFQPKIHGKLGPSLGLINHTFDRSQVLGQNLAQDLA